VGEKVSAKPTDEGASTTSGRSATTFSRRLNRGFKGQQPTLGRPPAQKLPAQAAPRAGFAADTS
jgi:hypothetical protein